MNGHSSNIRSTMVNISKVIVLNILLVFGFLIPGLGLWTKRLFFIMIAYHELERIQILTSCALNQLNCKILKINEPIVLTRVCEWTKSYNLNIDLEDLRKQGVDIAHLQCGGKPTAREMEILSKILIKSAPGKFKYDQVAMYQDIQRVLLDRWGVVTAPA